MKKIFYMHHFCAATMAAATVLSGGYAHSESEEDYIHATVRELPESGPATVEGKVVDIKNDYLFTMKDETGSVSVLMDPYTSPRIKTGDIVVVAGSVSSGKRNDKGVVADRLIVADNQLSESGSTSGTANENERQSNSKDKPEPGSALQHTKIRSLPNKGIVKVSGIVESVNGNKNTFVLKDSTGLVTIKREPSDRAIVKEGSSVTVVGSVDNKLFGKNINASSVSVDASATTTGSNTKRGYYEPSEE